MAIGALVNPLVLYYQGLNKQADLFQNFDIDNKIKKIFSKKILPSTTEAVHIDTRKDEEDIQRLNEIKEKIKGIVIEEGKFLFVQAEALLLVGQNQCLYTDDELLQELKFIYNEIIDIDELTSEAKEYFQKKMDVIDRRIEKYYPDSTKNLEEFMSSLHKVIYVEENILTDFTDKMRWLESIYFVLSIRNKKARAYCEREMKCIQECIIESKGSLAERLREALDKREIEINRKEMENQLNQYYNQNGV